MINDRTVHYVIIFWSSSLSVYRDFIAKLVEHPTDIAEAMGSNPVVALNFFQAKKCNCLNCLHTAVLSISQWI